MSLLLPQNPELLEMFDIADLAARNWVTLQEAKASAKHTFAKGDKSIGGVMFLVIRAGGDIELMRFGPLGGKSTLWNFGNPLVTGC